MKIIKPISYLVRFISGHSFLQIADKQKQYEMQRRIYGELNRAIKMGESDAKA